MFFLSNNWKMITRKWIKWSKMEITRWLLRFCSKYKKYSTTERVILSGVYFHFDPYGFLTLFKFKTRLLIREMMRKYVKRNEKLLMKVLNVQKRWLDGTKYISQVTIKKFVNKNVQFCSDSILTLQYIKTWSHLFKMFKVN